MFCTNCGSQFEDGNSFCPNCGTKVETVAQPVAAPAPAAAPVEAAPVEATPVEAAPVAAIPVAAAPVEPAPAPAPAPAPTPAAIPVQPVGAPVQPVAAPVQPVYAAATPIVNPAGNEDTAKNVLVMGIIAVACCVTYYFAFAGIIFGAIGLSKAKKFIEEAGQLYGKAKVGKYLSLGGLIGGCVLTGITLFYVLIYGLAIFSRLR